MSSLDLSVPSVPSAGPSLDWIEHNPQHSAITVRVRQGPRLGLSLGARSWKPRRHRGPRTAKSQVWALPARALQHSSQGHRRAKTKKRSTVTARGRRNGRHQSFPQVIYSPSPVVDWLAPVALTVLCGLIEPAWVCWVTPLGAGSTMCCSERTWWSFAEFHRRGG
jgi:hypothetical protein